MRPKRFEKVLSITHDNDLQVHMRNLSDECWVESLEYDDKLPGTSKPTLTVEQAIGNNLKLTALQGDAVNLPAHYARFKIEPVRFCVENKLGFLPSNVIKYTCRHDMKNGIEDLRKARRCLDMMIALLEGDDDWWKRKEAGA